MLKPVGREMVFFYIYFFCYSTFTSAPAAKDICMLYGVIMEFEFVTVSCRTIGF